MTVSWNANQPQVLKRAFVMVNAAEAVVIIAIMLAISISARPKEISLPEPNTPVISIPYPVFPLPPTIIPDRPARPPIEELLTPGDVAGPPLPVLDKDADAPTMPSQGELGVILGLDPHLGQNDPGVKFVPDTTTLQTKPEPERPVIPKPNDFVRTTKKPEAVKLETPVYPENCRFLGIHGITTVQMLLDLDGSVMETRVGKSSDNADLDSAAVRAARQSKFTPALGAHQKPVHVWVAVPFEFRIEH